jgi:hypothetical protein
MMADEPFFAPNAKPLPPRQPQPGELIWTLHKGTEHVECVLRSHGELGVETQLYRNGGFYGGRRFDLREDALGHADELKAGLLAMGWQVEP